MSQTVRKLGDFSAAMRHRRRLASAGTTREQLLSLQRRRLVETARHAAAASPLYRELYGGIDLAEDLDVRALPVVTKAMLMERFGEWVTDLRLRLSEIETHLERVRGDERYLDEYRCMATGGTTGQRGVFVYDRDEWRQCLVAFLRWSELSGLRPRLGRRVRVASVGAVSPVHMTARFGLSLDFGVYAMCQLDARAPLRELVGALNDHRPDHLIGYPSIVSLLAVEQIEDRLRIAPRVVCTTSEVRTEEMAANIRAAWGAEPFDIYGTTEALYAGDCKHHLGMHVFEDLGLVEVLDDRGEAPPEGVMGTQTAPHELHQAHPAAPALRDLRPGRAHGGCVSLRSSAGANAVRGGAQRRHPASGGGQRPPGRRAPVDPAQPDGLILRASPVPDRPRR